MQIKIGNSYWKSKKANKTQRYTAPVISLHTQLITEFFRPVCGGASSGYSYGQYLDLLRFFSLSKDKKG